MQLNGTDGNENENQKNGNLKDQSQDKSESDDGNTSIHNTIYHYIEAEKLIVDNIAKRIQKLTQERSVLKSGRRSATENGTDEHGSHGSIDNDDKSKISINNSLVSIKTDTIEDLKTTMLLYANIVTNNWVLGLVMKEIARLTKINDGKENMFLINLIPNRINVFRNCLYLKQAPNFLNFTYNYIAINLVKNISKKRDIDQLTGTNSNYDEVNYNFTNYFRIINKLIEIKVDPNKIRIYIKVIKDKNSFQINSISDLISFIKSPKKDGIQIDISELEIDDDFNNSLLFIIKNEIQLDEGEILVFNPNDISFDKIRKFALLYLKTKSNLQCDE